MSKMRSHEPSAEMLAARRQMLISRCHVQRLQLASQAVAIAQENRLWWWAGWACLRGATLLSTPRLSRLATSAWLAYRLFASLRGIRKP